MLLVEKEPYAVNEGANSLTIDKNTFNTLTTGGGKPGQGFPCVLEPEEKP